MVFPHSVGGHLVLTSLEFSGDILGGIGFLARGLLEMYMIPFKHGYQNWKMFHEVVLGH